MRQVLGVVTVAGAIACSGANVPVAYGDDAGERNETLINATSPFEDLAEAALAADTAASTSALDTAVAESAAVADALPAAEADEYRRLLAELKKAASGDDRQKTALLSVDLFRLLIDNFDESVLEVPKEVSLLDYVGFRLHVLDAAAKPDWDAIAATVAEGARWWDSVDDRVDDQGLRDAIDSTMEGLRIATDGKNLPMLHYAAQMDLDLVDLLEGYFEDEDAAAE